MEDTTRDLDTCGDIIRALRSESTHRDGTYEISSSDGLAGNSPGCWTHTGKDGKGYHTLLTEGYEKPRCDGQVREYSSRQKVCACSPYEPPAPTILEYEDTACEGNDFV